MHSLAAPESNKSRAESAKDPVLLDSLGGYLIKLSATEVQTSAIIASCAFFYALSTAQSIILSAAPVSLSNTKVLSTISFFAFLRAVKAFFAPALRRSLPACLMAFLRFAFAAATAGVAAEAVPRDATRAAAYAAPDKVSKVISAMVVAQDNPSAEQAK